MPANPNRKLVSIRLDGDVIRKLDKLCSDRMRSTGQHVHRSDILSELIRKAPPDKRAAAGR